MERGTSMDGVSAISMDGVSAVLALEVMATRVLRVMAALALGVKEEQTVGVPYPPHMRCSDADRDRAGAVVRESLGDGRISIAELDDRLDQVYRAQTYGDLAVAMADLPAWTMPGAPLPGPMGVPVPATGPVHLDRGLGLRRVVVPLVVAWICLAGLLGAGRDGGFLIPLLVIVMCVSLVRGRCRRAARSAGRNG